MKPIDIFWLPAACLHVQYAVAIRPFSSPSTCTQHCMEIKIKPGNENKIKILKTEIIINFQMKINANKNVFFSLSPPFFSLFFQISIINCKLIFELNKNYYTQQKKLQQQLQQQQHT